MYDLPHGIVRACAGVVEALDVLPDRYKQAVARAEESVGQSFDKDRGAQGAYSRGEIIHHQSKGLAV